jgi:DNA invertase Pin-like site-specific DNA recombinase
MLIGYARVSTQDQNLALQVDALNEFGCEMIFTEKESGAKKNRPEFLKCLATLRSGDSLVFYKIDRLGRTVRQLVELVDDLQARNVNLKSLTDPIDTSTSLGRFFLQIMACFAELERNLTRERTKAGLKAAKAKGRIGGRPPGLTKENRKKALAAYGLFKMGEFTPGEICRHVGISRTSYYKYIQIIEGEKNVREKLKKQKTRTRRRTANKQLV